MRTNGQSQSSDIRLLLPLDEAYPERLRHLQDAPRGLYAKGTLPPKDMPTAAIIGARDASDYGIDAARTIGRMLASRGVGIVSGLAYGIDAAAQWGAVDACGKAYAVMGCGLDICYPARHFTLYEEILRMKGGVLSEYPAGTPPLRHHFVQRNRLIAGLSDAVIVIEAKERSGTFTTVEYALEQGKEVFALPGRITDRMSIGCNRLIREGAHIITAMEDLLEFFHYKEERQAVLVQKDEITLDKSQKILYSCLDFKSEHLDEIIEKCKLPVQQALVVLMELELLGLVECTKTGYYRRKMDKR